MKIGIAVILNSEKSAVLIRRRPEGVHLGGYWEFPGGRVELGETHEQCIIREAHEETGLIIDLRSQMDSIEYAYPERTVTLMPAICEVIGGELTECSWIWAKLSDIQHYEFPPANDAILATLALHAKR